MLPILGWIIREYTKRWSQSVKSYSPEDSGAHREMEGTAIRTVLVGPTSDPSDQGRHSDLIEDPRDLRRWIDNSLEALLYNDVEGLGNRVAWPIGKASHQNHSINPRKSIINSINRDLER